jgi:ribonuclease Z
MSAQDFQHVLLSHHHGDHMGGLPHIQGQRTHTSPSGPPLEVYGTEESMAAVQRLFRATSITHQVDQDGLQTASGRRVVLWHPTEPGRWVQLSPQVRARSFPVDHISGAAGWRVESGGMSVVFSGDTRFSPHLVEAAQGARLLIHEVFSTEADKERTYQHGHSTAADAGRAASLAGAAELVITHIDTAFHFDPQPLVAEARRYFDGPIDVANDLGQITVGTL